MSAYELNEWMIYDQLFPFGDERADWRAGHAAAAVLNVNRAKGTPPLKAGDFVLQPPKTQRQKDQGLKGALRAAAKAKAKPVKAD